MPNFGLAVRSAGAVTTSGAGVRLMKDVTGVVRSIDAVAPGMGRVFTTSRAPLSSINFINLVKSAPAKAMATLATAVAGGVLGQLAIEELLEDRDPAVREFASKAAKELSELLISVGITDMTPEEDGKIAKFNADEVRVNVAITDVAQEVFDNACAAVGGRARLLAVMQWLAVDDDLKQIIIDRGMQ